MAERLRVGIVGAGTIAAEFAAALPQGERCTPYAVAARNPDRAAAFAARHGVPVVHSSYDALLADDAVDLVYIAVVHPLHVELAIRAAGAGRHVLVEKPIALSEPQARRAIAAAEAHGTFLHEAFAYRFHPQTVLVEELVRAGRIGEVRAVDVAFGYDGDDPRALARDLGGGGILDVGCYCTSLAHLVASAASAASADNPVVESVEVLGAAGLDPVERTDAYAFGLIRFANGLVAQVACATRLQLDDHVFVYGSAGRIEIRRPCWHGRWRADETEVTVVAAGDAHRETFVVPGGPNIFAREADGVAALLDAGPAACRPGWDATLANMRTLDRWRAACGVAYADEV